MTLTVVDLDSSHEWEYRAFCEGTPDLLIYYTWQFRSFLIDLLGCRSVYKVAVDQVGHIQGVLPLMEVEGRFGRVLNSLPFFGSNGGVVARSEAARTLLWRSYAEMLEKPDIASSTVIGNPLLGDPVCVPQDVTDKRIGQVTKLDLVGDPETMLMKKLDPTARRNIRRAQNAGVTVAVDNEALATLAAIHNENMTAVGGRVKPRAFFELLPKHFRPGTDWNLYVARHEQGVVACLLLLYSGNTVDYYIPGTRFEDRNIQPSALLIFRAMLDAHGRGCTVWNWGGTWLSQEGVLRFKRKWGAVDHPYTYYVKIQNPGLLQLDRKTLLDAYGYFYTVPFDRLKI